MKGTPRFAQMFALLIFCSCLLSVTSSIEALDVFRADPHAFDLVITDMTMPGLTGAQPAKELMTIKSDLLMILCTGFSELISEYQAGEAGISAFVMKPYAVSSLAKSIAGCCSPNEPSVD
jgi:CheY-like chemotaxis protein